LKKISIWNGPLKLKRTTHIEQSIYRYILHYELKHGKKSILAGPKVCLSGCMITLKTKINSFWYFFLHSKSLSETLHSKRCQKTLIFSLCANSATPKTHFLTISKVQKHIFCNFKNGKKNQFGTRKKSLNLPKMQFLAWKKRGF
jgi:hypothetical protein